MSSKAEVSGRIVGLLQLVIASSVMTNERIARAITRVLDRLEGHGYIERMTDPSDRRRVVVRVRPELAEGVGRGGDDDPYAAILEGMQRVHEQFTVDELEVVARYLDAVKDVR